MDGYFRKFLFLVLIVLGLYYISTLLWKDAPKTQQECGVAYIEQFGSDECDAIRDSAAESLEE